MEYIKHITIINQYIGSPYHGMEYRHYYLAKNLIEQGYAVTLVSASYSHLFSNPPEIEGDFKKEIIDDIEYIWIRTPKYRSSKSIGRVWNMLYFARALRKIDKEISRSHIIVSSPSLFPVRFGYKMAKKFGAKLLFEVRDIWPLTLVEISGLSAINPIVIYMRFYEKFAYKHSSKVISLLPTAKEYFENSGMDRKKFVYLPNGIEMQKGVSVLLAKSVMEKIPKDKFIVAYTGTVGIANNLDYLIDAAEALRENSDIHFIILGQGGEKERLLKKVENLKLTNVTFLGPISKMQVSSFLDVIDVAFISLLPEKIFRYGVSPNKVFDYMYAKKPIIWAIEAGNNLVDEANCGLSVSLNDVNVLKEAILKLKFMSVVERESLGKNGYNFVKINHSYKMLARRLINMIEE